MLADERTREKGKLVKKSTCLATKVEVVAVVARHSDSCINMIEKYAVVRIVNDSCKFAVVWVSVSAALAVRSRTIEVRA